MTTAAVTDVILNSGVLIRQYRHFYYRPLHPDPRIVPPYRPLALFVPGRRDLVEKLRSVLEGKEAVGEAGGDPELQAVFGAQLHALPAPEGGGVAPDIHRDVEHPAPHHPHQLALGMRRALVVQPAQHASARNRVVVLDEAAVEARRGAEDAVIVALEERPPRVLEDARGEEHEPGEGERRGLHQACSFSSDAR